MSSTSTPNPQIVDWIGGVWSLGLRNACNGPRIWDVTLAPRGLTVWELPRVTNLVLLRNQAKNIVTSRDSQEYSAHKSQRDAEMIDDNQVKKQVFIRHLGSPLVMAPLLMGVTSLTAAWAFDWKAAGVAAFAGIAGILASGGIFLTRLILGGENTAASVIQEAEAESIEQREKDLDRLERELEISDDDPRPEKALRDHRSLVSVLKETTHSAKGHHLATMVDIHARVTELFEHCVELLEQTIQLWQTAEKLSTPVARKPILDQRESLIEDIQKSVHQVSDTLVGLKQLGTTEVSSNRLKEMRAELDQSLHVARSVEDRVNRMMRDSRQSIH